MTFFAWLAAIVLFLQLPIPLYWFVVHPLSGFWRHRQKLGLIAGLLLSWPPVTACIIVFRHELFAASRPAVWRIVLGLAVISFEIWLFAKLTRDLGTARLIGKTELSGGGSIARHGIYANIRHPRYLGSFLAIVGACLIAARPVLWAVAGAWTLLMLAAITMEEREMRARFGAEFENYARQVPRFVPAWRTRGR
ncbi:MAG TPA: isoprenylcysteine carboxylmethyltransferase family protein [Candidatus Acidoferrales bacterium]|nr:isoprenylcysteine carboxylmethyltransferase family protein [Candidatus Acidoferrales bacterium]